jgi:hypothetical protein
MADQPACSHCGSTHASRGRWKTPLNDRENPAVWCFNARRCQQRKRRAEKHAGQLELELSTIRAEQADICPECKHDGTVPHLTGCSHGAWPTTER